MGVLSKLLASAATAGGSSGSASSLLQQACAVVVPATQATKLQTISSIPSTSSTRAYATSDKYTIVDHEYDAVVVGAGGEVC